MEATVAKDWDALAAQWENDDVNIEFVESAHALLEKTVSTEGKHILDMGCGTGLMTEFVAMNAKSVVALDSSELMIEELDKKGLRNVEPVVDLLTRGLVAQHPAFRKQFDVIVASSVFGYLENISEAMEVIYSLMDKDGVFVHWDWINDDEDRTEGVSTIQMQDELIQAGFASVKMSHAFRVRTPKGYKSAMMGVAIK
ncbi:class I SAM-dependent DNA methyltransferase [Vibrio salinus]|uniref:class I SAM-dependent DNA methyltransferase n=1 Tax=Vibrio salinus TaxID=2899784 RepID=UPI001E2DEFAE|nr:class I SAM-dependent methyltransferase [Vibrio salinus]MCE0494928.1 class I SAM-dependent methyltransferase [Vibrio salinus]